jgi:hypothetical protein
MRKLLICLCYHHDGDDGLQVLFRNIENINAYAADVTLVIHTNTDDAKQLINDRHQHVITIVAKDMLHPYHLTWQHRSYIRDHLGEYDVVMYAEHDMMITGDQVDNYLENIQHMWPDYCPALVRYEISCDGDMVAVEAAAWSINKLKFVELNAKYADVGLLYSACWILPTVLLQQVITNSFCTMDAPVWGVREHAASFVNYTLKKPLLLQLVPGEMQISPLSLIHHASNKYVNMKNSCFGKTKISELFKI